MSAPVSTMAREFRLFQFGLATESENDSTPFNASGRIASGMSFTGPITIVTGPASSVFATILGFLPNTLAKSDRRSSVAFCTGAGAFGSRRITAEPSSRISLPLEPARAAGFLWAALNSQVAQNGIKTAIRRIRRRDARRRVALTLIEFSRMQ